MREKVLVVEPDASSRALILSALKASGYTTIEARTGASAIDLYHAQRPDLIILNVRLPDITGLEVCRRLRRVSNVRIILVSDDTGEVDELLGFAVGADDYITRPFSSRMIAARVDARLAHRLRHVNTGPQTYSVGPLMLDTESRILTVNDEEVTLSRQEFDLLAMLMENPRRVVTREQIMDRLWNDYYDPHVMEVTLSRLRKRVLDAGGPRIAIAVPRVGYRLGIHDV